ncbi:uncharacterized protein LOC115696624 [Cannabis sativa]|uniref:uncharacterized protein LOC115696624 n=1 Tax=Cannabis sativa TaxID=3483 RepID=UPI0011DF51CB|nr:uncharacterized protein LOC115696624 [Cannabis sativa]
MFHLSCYYGSPYITDKNNSWTLLSRLFDVSPLAPWIIVGDFNDYLGHNDRNSHCLPPPHAMHRFQNFLYKYSLSPLPFSGSRFTWKHGTSLERLDWAIVDHKWNTLFPTASLHHLPFFFGSDHRAIKVVFDGNPMIFRHDSHFCIENHWFLELDFFDLVKIGWTLKVTPDTIKFPLQANWLKAGDKNTKYFHSRASTRKRNNFIKSLTLNDNSSVSRLQDITNSFVHFYSNLFTSQGTDYDSIALILQGINKTITPDQHAFLDSQFDLAEVKRALFQLVGDKAPRPDGLNYGFYQKHWDIVGIDLCNAALHVLNTNADIAPLNETILVLIPKVNNACRIKDFWAISLCSTIYKVVFKAIANRLKSILPDLISHNKGVFLSDHIIFNNIIIANEVIHAITNRKTEKVGWAALKLDMEKAFDKVEWDFIRHVLHHFSFPSHLISLTLRCLSSVSFCLHINNSLSPQIFPSRGIRQGDPLSPIFCFWSAPPISHLLFVDDSLLFTRVTSLILLVVISKTFYSFIIRLWVNRSTSKNPPSFSLPILTLVSFNVFHAPKNHLSFFSFKKPAPNYLCGTKTFSLKLTYVKLLVGFNW